MKSILLFIRKLWREMEEDDALGLAAVQAFYFTLSIFPMLILLLSVLPYLAIGEQNALDIIYMMIPEQTAEIFQHNVVTEVSSHNKGLLTVSVIGTIWSASLGMHAFIRSMNKAFNVKETRSFIKSRLLSIMLTVGIIITFLVVLVLPIFGDVILNLVGSFMYLPPETDSILRSLRWIVAIFVVISILSALYYFAPNKNISFYKVIPGALVATLLWQLVSLGFSFYVSNFANFSVTYGSLGGMIVLMLWFFLTGLSFVIGGEMNALLYKKDTTANKPNSDH